MDVEIVKDELLRRVASRGYCRRMDSAATLLSVLASRAPVYLTLLVGVVFAIVRWPSHPKVSLMAVLGLSSQLLLSMVGLAVSTLLPQYLHADHGMGFVEVGRVLAAWSIVMSLMQAASWVLVIVAIFGSRLPRGTAAG